MTPGILLAIATLWSAFMVIITAFACSQEHKSQLCADFMDETRSLLFFLPIPQSLKRTIPEDFMSVLDCEFEGKTIVPERDAARLRRQYDRVFAVMSDGQPHTLAEISKRTGDGEASVSARLRDMRRVKFGSNDIRTTHVADGLHQYRLVLAKTEMPEAGVVTS